MGKTLFRQDIAEMMGISRCRVQEFMHEYGHTSSGKYNLRISEEEYKTLEAKGVIEEWKHPKEERETMRVKRLESVVINLTEYLAHIKSHYPNVWMDCQRELGGMEIYERYSRGKVV